MRKEGAKEEDQATSAKKAKVAKEKSGRGKVRPNDKREAWQERPTQVIAQINPNYRKAVASGG
eukprot:1996249-Rhodomonas_salina.1